MRNHNIENKYIAIGNRNNNLHIKVNYSPRRKNLGIAVRGSDQVIVHAPAGISDREIKKIVQTKINWIEKKRHMWREIEASLQQRNWTSGEQLLVSGEKYKLVINEEKWRKSPSVRLTDSSIHVLTPVLDSVFLRQAILAWYNRLAAETIEQRLSHYVQLMSLRPGTVRIKNQKTRWGSCSAQNNLNFNWRLVMAPQSVMDYVIVHELSHITHKNHSRDFWLLVDNYIPDRKISRSWLRKNGHMLEI